MIAAVLLALAVVAVPPSPAAHKHMVAPTGCPWPAIGFYSFTPGAERDIESHGGGTFVNASSRTVGDELVMRFWRSMRGYPPAAATVAADERTHTVRAITGSVRNVDGVWCVFSELHPPPSDLRDDPA